MRIRKIRGHRRRQRAVDSWAERARAIDPVIFDESIRIHEEILVHPWSGISLTDSTYPQPKGLTRQHMITGLAQTMEAWHAALLESGCSFYLALWLFEPRFSLSQVVCATGDQADFYNNTFGAAVPGIEPDFKCYGQAAADLRKLKWTGYTDEDIFLESDFSGAKEEYIREEDYYHDQRTLRKLQSGKYQVETIDSGGGKETVFHIPRGLVFVGQK